MLFAKNINRICKERGTTLTALVKQVKNSSSGTTAINKGYLPKEAEMLEYAKILDCSVMDFFSDDDEEITISPRDEDEKDILRVYRSLSRRGKHEFMAMVYEYENNKELTGGNDNITAI